MASLATGTPEEDQLDVLVIGAGPAGLGTGLVMLLVDELVFGVLERGRVGETFRRWPERMRFLTPSFTGNAFGSIDLNAIHPETSPAHTLKVDYPGGAGYAHYLASVVEHFGVPLRQHCGVLAVEPWPDGGGFNVVTSEGSVPTKTVVWAGGEFGTPHRPRIPGHELGVHTARPAAWSAPDEAPVVVVGGYESGIDVACALVADGHPVTVLDPESPWETTGSDPSLTLAPRTRQRLFRAESSGLLDLAGKHAATAIEHDGTGYVVDAGGTRFRTPVAPVLATGFRPTLGPVAELFERRPDGWPLLSGDDESTITPRVVRRWPIGATRRSAPVFCVQVPATLRSPGQGDRESARSGYLRVGRVPRGGDAG